MKARMALVAMGLTLIAALAGSATFAWFTATAGNSGNSFAAGTLEIKGDRNYWEYVPGPMFYTTAEEGSVISGSNAGELGIHPTGLWFPGKTVTRSYDVINTGTLRARLRYLCAEVTSLNGIFAGDPAFDSALAYSFTDKMHVKVYVSGQPDWVLYEGDLTTLLSEQVAGYTIELPASPHAKAHLIFTVTMKETAGNDLQGIRPVVSFRIKAEQAINNPL